MTIEMMLFFGAIAGLVIGFVIFNPKIGCITLCAVPVGMIAYISWWQNAHPENIRSTSGLDFLFGPLWPSLGALAGFLLGTVLRAMLESRRS